MNREEAIEILKDLWRTKHSMYLEADIRKALEMAIQALEQEEPTYYPPCIDCNKKMDEIRCAYDKLKEQEPKWIPVGERLPDKEGQYLVTVQFSSLGVNSMELANFSLDLSNVSCLFKHEKGRSGWWGCDDGGWNTFMYSGVIAWMPLPDLYKPKESEE